MRDPEHTTVAEASPSAPASRLVFSRVNPLECADEIKRLFVAHERPEFPDFFDRTYADAVADGASSWVGRDVQGAMCAHIAQFPRPFRLGSRVVRGALMANLMMAKEHRTLWPALALVRQTVKDSRDSGSLDFICGDPNEAAHAIVRAVGFRTVGMLRRFVLPLRDRRGPVNLGLRVYRLYSRFRAHNMSLRATARPAAEMPAGPEMVEAVTPGALSPAPRPAVYRHRLPGYPSANDWWYTFRVHGESQDTAPVGAALVRGPDDQGRAVVCAVRYESLDLLSSVLFSLAGEVRLAGAARVELWVMGNSQVAAELQRAGFVARDEQAPVVAMPLTPLGTEAMGVGAEWRVFPVDLDR